jgi:hypothetical protein
MSCIGGLIPDPRPPAGAVLHLAAGAVDLLVEGLKSRLHATN